MMGIAVPLDVIDRVQNPDGSFKVWSTNGDSYVSTCDCHKFAWSFTDLTWDTSLSGLVCPIDRNESL